MIKPVIHGVNTDKSARRLCRAAKRVYDPQMRENQETETNRYFTEKCAPPLLGMLAQMRELLNDRDPRQIVQRKDAAAEVLHAANLMLWPLNWRNVPAPPRTHDTLKTLAQKLIEAKKGIEETTSEYITTVHCGFLFWPIWPSGKKLPPECPITIEGEQAVLDTLREHSLSLTHARPSRQKAPARKLIHTYIAYCGIIFGAFAETRNQFTDETLSWAEVKELFDRFCPYCGLHTTEQTRKIVERLADTIRKPIHHLTPSIFSCMTTTRRFRPAASRRTVPRLEYTCASATASELQPESRAAIVSQSARSAPARSSL